MSFSLVMHLRPDALVLCVTFVFCLLATLLFSLGPALKATRADLVNDLKQQVGDPALAGRLNRFFAGRHLLVMAQIALSLMLLFSAGLFLRGALKASGLDPGFEARDGIVAEMDFTLGKTDEAAAKRTMFKALERMKQLRACGRDDHGALRQSPSRAASCRQAAPLAKSDPNAKDAGMNGLFNAVTSGYFESIGV
jgi:hypothetical protein